MVRMKFLTGLLLLAVLALAFTSCNNVHKKEKAAERSVELDTIRVAQRSHLEDDTANPYCDISVEFIYPVSSTGANAVILQQFFTQNMLGNAFAGMTPETAVNAYVKSYIENYTYDAETYRESVTDLKEWSELIPDAGLHDQEQRSGGDFYSYQESLLNRIVYNRHGVLSFQVEQSNSKGGATSFVSFRNWVIDVNSGKQVTENELFQAGYDQALQKLIIASLFEQNNVKSVDELEDLGFFGIQEIVPNRNFLLTGQGIIYTYNKGEYSAYQLDAPEVFIPYTAIRSLLRENTPAAKLADLK
ncbi:MAG: RsiV family protein [Bacteroidota bacterium]|jgi:hypothetical protein|nr:RsiV family protein [Bacteroidota bacterium]HHU97048.1 DUF3298 domain-containing protein [Petrimonas sp.]